MVSATVFPADRGDTLSLLDTIGQSQENLEAVGCGESIVSVVTDKGYHKASVIHELYWEEGLTTYIPERRSPERRRWHGDKRQCQAFHANRKRCQSGYGKGLLRQRAAIVERVFAHLLETGGLRRTHLRGRENIQKRYLAHVLAYNLSIMMRVVCGFGTPRSTGDLKALVVLLFLCGFILAQLRCLFHEET